MEQYDVSHQSGSHHNDIAATKDVLFFLLLHRHGSLQKFPIEKNL